MTIWRAIGRQLEHPHGAGGWAIGRFMRLVNAQPNRLAIAALDISAGDQILELGCGPGHGVALLTSLAPRGTVFALDQSSSMVAQARAANRNAVRSGRVRLSQSRFERLDFATGSMDKVLAVNVAYFWHDSEIVLSEVRRVLRPNGMLSLYVTDARTMRHWKFADRETHRLFDRESLCQSLKCGGFSPAGIAVRTVRVARSIDGLIATAQA